MDLPNTANVSASIGGHRVSKIKRAYFSYLVDEPHLVWNLVILRSFVTLCLLLGSRKSHLPEGTSSTSGDSNRRIMASCQTAVIHAVTYSEYIVNYTCGSVLRTSIKVREQTRVQLKQGVASLQYRGTKIGLYCPIRSPSYRTLCN